VIDQILIINHAGLSLYSWSPNNENRDSTLISGFLTALNMFAVGDRGEEIQKINLNPTTFIFDRAQDLIFVMLTKNPDLENILKIILKAMKVRFLELHSESIKNFNGELNIFAGFTKELEIILQRYGYFDYQRVSREFANTNTIESVVYMDKLSGDLLYIKSKGYLDRKTIGFQTLILIKTAERILSTFQESLSSLVVVTDSPRCLIVNTTEKIILFHELKTLAKDVLNLKPITEKKINALIKKPGKLVFETLDPFVIMNQQGTIAVTNDKQDRLKKHEIYADCVTLSNNANNIARQMYKEQVYSIIIIGKCMSFIAFPLENYLVFLQIDVKQCEESSSRPGTKEYCEYLTTIEHQKMKEIFARINEFREKFDEK